jgi:electron transfer flavoprotein beta subunit
MRILVLVKQVPGTSDVSIDPETGTLRREGVPVKTNPYDLHALEAALQLRDRLQAVARGGAPAAPEDDGPAGESALTPDGATVTVVSMGPPQAEAVIRESYWMGADDGVLLTDRAFAGADTLATAFALSQAARRIGFDLIIAGMQSTDGDTAQVGPGVAEFLGIPHTSYVSAIGRVSPLSIEVTADLGDRHLTQEISFPCLITVTGDLNQPRLPSFRARKETAGRTVDVMGPGDLPPSDEQHYGLNGSPTRVTRVFPPKRERVREMWEGPADELAGHLAALLKEVLAP